MSEITVAFPLGIGDCHWSCMKLKGLRALHPGREIHAYVNESPNHTSVGFLELVDHIDAAHCSKKAPYDINSEILGGYKDERWASLRCRNWNGFDYLIVANGHVESGVSMDEFIPELETEYEYGITIHDEDREKERVLLGRRVGLRPVVLYFSGVGPNTAFHGNTWTTGHWCQVVELLNREGITPVIIGAPTTDDLGYMEQFRKIARDVRYIDIVGHTTIPMVLSLIQRAGCWVGLNSGTGIISAMMRTPTCMFWSNENHKCGAHTGFNPGMQRNWLSADQLEKYRTFSYGSPELRDPRSPHSVVDTIMEIKR